MSEQSSIELSSFEALFKSHYSELCAYANKFLDDLAASEEVVQSLFVKLWENKKEVLIDRSPKSYLYTATKNACFNQIRHIKIKEQYKEYNQLQLEKEQYTVEDEYQAVELNTKIRMAIDSLPEGRRKIFILSRFEGLKYKEIAAQLKISIKTVENQMGSAIKHLKVDLAEYLTVILIIILS